MKQHQTEIICTSNQGYILWCHCCQDIQLGFGNMLLSFDFDQFLLFKNYICSIPNNQICFDSYLNKNIFLRREGATQGYCVSEEELIELKLLLVEGHPFLSIKKQVRKILD